MLGDVDFFSVQESHWGFDCDWSTSSWHFVHSSTGQQRSGGILAGVNAKHSHRESVKWRDVVPGRLLHVRFTYKLQQIDLIVLYQHAMTFSKGELRKGTFLRRAQLWRALDTLLGSLPLRSSVVLMGDFNATLEPSRHVAGSGIKLGGQSPDVLVDRRAIMDVLRRHKLCALNTWSKVSPTYEHPKGISQIDYICIRQALADGRSKQCGVLPAPIAAWRPSGHHVLTADLPLNWQPWKHSRQTSKTRTTQVFPQVAEVVEEAAVSLDRISGSLRQHSDRPAAKPTKPARLRSCGARAGDLSGARGLAFRFRIASVL